MAQTISTIDGNIQYVLNDTSQFILESSDSQQFGNVICTDGTQAIFIDGELIADSSAGDGQTYVLQDSDLNQYYIQTTDEILVSAAERQSSAAILETIASTSEELLSHNQLIQLVDEEGNLISTGTPNILCIEDDEAEIGEYQLVEGFQDDTQTLQLQPNQVVDLEDLIQQQAETQVVEIAGEENRYQYAILKDGKLHIQSYPEYDLSQDFIQVANDSLPTEWDKITGRNLITGKQLSLRSLVDKPQKKCSKKCKRKTKNNLEGLLNKKLDLGKTVNGKKLVGKIIHIRKKQQENETNIQQENGEQVTYSPQNTSFMKRPHTENDTDKVKDTPPKIGDANTVQTTSTENVSTSCEPAFILKRRTISKEVLDQISKTLSGLMKLDSVKKKLKNKYLLVKAIERRYVQSNKQFEKNISYSSGHMVDNYLVNQETGDLMQSWSYVPEVDKNSEDISETEVAKNTLFQEVIQLTFHITLQKNGQHVKVVLDPDGSPFKCGACNKNFKTKVLLNVHLSTHHGISVEMKQCEQCAYSDSSDAEWEEHRKYHDGQQVMGCVEEGCDASFANLEKLSRHAEVHRKNTKEALRCSRCPYQCADLKELSNHQLTSHGIVEKNYSIIDRREAGKNNQESKQIKSYTCEVCRRTFSRYSNLMRHVEIHIGKAMYRCSICGSAYQYVSSLTRHMVQNHVKV